MSLKRYLVKSTKVSKFMFNIFSHLPEIDEYENTLQLRGRDILVGECDKKSYMINLEEIPPIYIRQLFGLSDEDKIRYIDASLCLSKIKNSKLSIDRLDVLISWLFQQVQLFPQLEKLREKYNITVTDPILIQDGYDTPFAKSLVYAISKYHNCDKKFKVKSPKVKNVLENVNQVEQKSSSDLEMEKKRRRKHKPYHRNEIL